MIDPTIEQALAPSKEDWKEPLLAKFKNYAIGFGAALLMVGAIVAAIAYFAEPLAPQTEPVTMTIEPVPQVTAKAQKRVKVATENVATKPANAPATAVTGNPVSVPKPRIKDDFNAEFDKEQARFETNLKKEFP